MQKSAQGNSAQLENALTEALEAAAGRVGERAKQLIMAARLATAVHMHQAAETHLAGHTDSSWLSSPSAAPANTSGAAGLVCRGGQQ